MATSLEWRRLWRARGLSLDRLLPVVYALPAPTIVDLSRRVQLNVVVPGDGRRQLVKADSVLILDAAMFVAGFVAEILPAQVTATDLKPSLPHAASALAVLAPGSTAEYVGSFDMLLKIFASRAQPWKQYHGCEMALDVKLCGATSVLGLNGATMRAYFGHARTVLAASRGQDNRLGKCQLVAFLLRRPAGPTAEGAAHTGSFGFVALSVDALLRWDPRTSRQPPPTVVLSGGLLRRGSGSEAVALPAAPPPARPDLWADLARCCQQGGWVTALDFCKVFGLGSKSLRKGTEGVLKRLREKEAELTDSTRAGVGRPPKMARLSDLKRCYPEFAV